MSSYFTYGVFNNQQDFSKAFAELSNKDFLDITVVKDTNAPLYRSAKVQLSVKRTFIFGGLAGAVIGGIAGAVASPTVPFGPFNHTYQLLTPMMSMVSGAILMAYFAVWICGFLSWLDKPVPADAFEGTITNGALLLAVETERKDLQQVAMACFSQYGAVEIIARSESIGALATVQEHAHVQAPIKVPNIQLAA